MDFILPFKVGDLVESRSFTPGFRGAWFRSKISVMCVRQGHLECLLEYIDFPDEKKTWTRLYKVRPGCRKQKSSKSSESRDIMIRPTFPQWHWENQRPDHHPENDVVAIFISPWKVGDLIEWWYTDCYWSGKIIKVFGDDKVKIVLHQPPIGEGGFYDADCKDLRPALEWSLEKGWHVPLSQENGKCWYNARLSTQKTDTGNSSSDEENEPPLDVRDEVRNCLNLPSDMPVEVMETGTKLPANRNDKLLVDNRGYHKEEALKCFNGTSEMPPEVTNSNVDLPPYQNAKRCTRGETGSPKVEGGEPCEALVDVESIEPTSVEASPDTVDDNMMELEKVANRIRRLENLLLSMGSTPSNVAKPSWKLLDKEASMKQN